MSWKTIYNERKTTAAEAVKHIKSGNRVVISHAAGEPSHLIDAMVANKDAYKDVEIVHMLPLGKTEYTEPGMEAHFRHNALFVGGKTRLPVEEARADFTPCYFSQIPNMFKKSLPVDVALVHVSTPDEHGYCSFGVAVDYSKPAAEMAKLVIAQVNPQMPRTLGDSFMHISKFNYIVEHDAPLIYLNPPAIGDVEKAIGEYCASLVNDGDCLQLGIGAIPDAALSFMRNKKDIGIHTEMFADGVIDLVEAGVINNSKKNLHPGKMIATFLMGTQRVYDFVHNNPMVNMYPSTYTNNPYVAGQNDNLVSINSCVSVDLTGQVCSESDGIRQISAVGGQVDFVRAAAVSNGGRSIIAFPSIAGKKQISKIVPTLSDGSIVTTNRYDVEYIITEHGIANLKHKSNRERARALISIAHPSARDELKEEFKRRFKTSY